VLFLEYRTRVRAMCRPVSSATKSRNARYECALTIDGAPPDDMFVHPCSTDFAGLNRLLLYFKIQGSAAIEGLPARVDQRAQSRTGGRSRHPRHLVHTGCEPSPAGAQPSRHRAIRPFFVACVRSGPWNHGGVQGGHSKAASRLQDFYAIAVSARYALLPIFAYNREVEEHWRVHPAASIPSTASRAQAAARRQIPDRSRVPCSTWRSCGARSSPT
jgi:hypothetical protein